MHKKGSLTLFIGMYVSQKEGSVSGQEGVFNLIA